VSLAPIATDGFDLEGLAWKSGALLVGDRRRLSAGYPVHALDADAACGLHERAPVPLFLPLPPVALQ
jgi:hypothetical protein